MAVVTHRLKTHPAAFYAVRDGLKPFEARKNDRLFQSGDLVEFLFWDPSKPSNPECDFGDGKVLKVVKPFTKRIGWILGGGQYGIEPGHVVFALEDPDGGPSRYEVVADQLERLRGYGSNLAFQLSAAKGSLSDDQWHALQLLKHACSNAAKVLFIQDLDIQDKPTSKGAAQ